MYYYTTQLTRALFLVFCVLSGMVVYHNCLISDDVDKMKVAITVWVRLVNRFISSSFTDVTY